ncbi:MAG: hypothetical protein WDN50_06010 [Bradyrhizobium sp.]
MLYFFALCFVGLIAALLGTIFYMLDRKPQSDFSILLEKHKEIGGPILGALITVMAAGLAFLSVQMQLQAPMAWRPHFRAGVLATKT